MKPTYEIIKSQKVWLHLEGLGKMPFIVYTANESYFSDSQEAAHAVTKLYFCLPADISAKHAILYFEELRAERSATELLQWGESKEEVERRIHKAYETTVETWKQTFKNKFQGEKTLADILADVLELPADKNPLIESYVQRYAGGFGAECKICVNRLELRIALYCLSLIDANLSAPKNQE